jgi:endoglycosylceramidase
VFVVVAVLAAAALVPSLADAAGRGGGGAGGSGAGDSGGVGGWAGAGIVKAPGGPFLTDASGRRLQLHGVNLVAKCGGGAHATTAVGTPCVGPERGPQPAFVLTPTANDPGRRLTASDARTLARLGLNVVRLGIIWEGLEPGPKGVGPNDPRYCAPHAAGTPFQALGAAGPYNAGTVRSYLAKTDKIVKLLSAAGIRVVLDMHQDAWGSAFSDPTSPVPWNGEGAPPWATCTDGAAFTPPLLWSSAYFSAPVEAAIHHFWANDVSGDLQGQFARVWQAVARHYRQDPDVIGYEIYNEPADFADQAKFDRELQCDYGGPVHEPRSCADSGANAVRDGLIGAIQSADHDHVVFFEPGVLTDYGQPETIGITEPLRFKRVALAFHLYNGTPSHLLATITPERGRTRTEQPGGPPWIMDEFGADNDNTVTATMVRLADHLALSWTYWAGLQLHDPTGNPFEALIDERTRKPHRAKALTLAVPYPSATAGTPGSQTFNARTGRFIYNYAPGRQVRAPTEIVVPGYTYPHGYRARVQGGHVVSARGTSPLMVSPLAGSARVRITVTRRG